MSNTYLWGLDWNALVFIGVIAFSLWARRHFKHKSAQVYQGRPGYNFMSGCLVIVIVITALSFLGYLLKIGFIGYVLQALGVGTSNSTAGGIIALIGVSGFVLGAVLYGRSGEAAEENVGCILGSLVCAILMICGGIIFLIGK